MPGINILPNSLLLCGKYHRIQNEEINIIQLCLLFSKYNHIPETHMGNHKSHSEEAIHIKKLTGVLPVRSFSKKNVSRPQKLK